MMLDMNRILESKRAHRSHLAALPIAEKLRLLDALRERTVALRAAGAALRGAKPQQTCGEYKRHLGLDTPPPLP